MKVGGCCKHLNNLKLSYGHETWWVQLTFRVKFSDGHFGVIRGHLGVIRGQITKNCRIDMKLGGYSQHLESKFWEGHFGVTQGSSEVLLLKTVV